MTAGARRLRTEMTNQKRLPAPAASTAISIPGTGASLCEVADVQVEERV